MFRNQKKTTFREDCSVEVNWTNKRVQNGKNEHILRVVNEQ